MSTELNIGAGVLPMRNVRGKGVVGGYAHNPPTISAISAKRPQICIIRCLARALIPAPAVSASLALHKKTNS